MKSAHPDEIAANLERAGSSLAAARELVGKGYFDFAASRAYYSAFYAAAALLLSEGFEFSKHSGVIALIHQRFVKTGKLTTEQGKSLNWLFELRSVGDYGGTEHVSHTQIEEALKSAENFLSAVKGLLSAEGES